MSNLEIINHEASKKGFVLTGNNLHTFTEWKAQGMSVKKGQKAFISTRLWSSGENRRLVPAYLFKDTQVLCVS